MADGEGGLPKDRWGRRIAAIAFVLLACWFYRRTTAYSAPGHVDLSKVAWMGLDGSRFPVEKLEGRAVMINFWAPWCGPCRREIPWLKRLQAEHPDLVVIGVEDDPEVLQQAVSMASSEQIQYPLVQNSDAVRAEFGHVVELPTTLYVSRSGKVLHTVGGLIPEALMEHYAKDALAAD